MVEENASDLELSVSKVKRIMKDESSFDRITNNASKRVAVSVEAYIRKLTRQCDKVLENKGTVTIMQKDVNLVLDLRDDGG